MKGISLLVVASVCFSSVFAQTSNVGIGTNTPQTKLQVAGAISSVPSSAAAGNNVTIPDNISIFRLTFTPGGSTTTLTLTNPKEGQYLTIYNEDDNPATFAGKTIAALTGVMSFDYINSAWRMVSDNQAGVGGVTTVTASPPLNSTGGSTPNISLSGTIPVANGGTGINTIGAGQLLVGTAAGGFLNTTLTGTNNEVNVNSASGAITLSTPQDIATSSNVQFNTATLNTATDINSLNAGRSIKVGSTSQTPAGAGAGSIRYNSPNVEYSDGSSWKSMSTGGTVTNVATGSGLTGGPITNTGTISIATGGVTNAMLANSSVTVTAGTGLTGGGAVPLGGSTTVSLSTPVAAGNGGTGLSSLGSANQVLGVNTAGTGMEYKTIQAGTNVTITPTANNIKIDAAGSGLTGSGTANYHPKWTSATGLAGTSLVYDNGTGVAINTTSTPGTLSVNGSAVIGSALTSRAGQGITVSYNNAATYAANGDVGDANRALSVVNEGSTANSMSVISMRSNPSGGANNQMLDMKLVNPNDGTSKLIYSFGPNASFTDRFTFTNAGRLGIGTTAPGDARHVSTAEGSSTPGAGVTASGGASGNAKMELRGGTPYIDFANNASTTDYDVRLLMNTPGNLQLSGGTLDMTSHKIVNVTDPTNAQDAVTKNYVDNKVNGTVSGTTNYVSKFTGANTIGNSTVFDNGSGVGIGTTTISFPLTVRSSSSSANAIVTSLANAIGDANFQLNATRGATTNASGDVTTVIGQSYNGATPTDAMRFHRGGGASDGAISFITNSTERIRIDNAGNVGIGTNTPTNKLQVEGNLHMDGNTMYFRTGPADQYDLIRWNGSSDRLDIGGYNGVNLGYTSPATNVVSPVLTVASANVGVGLTNPAYKLEINGSFGYGDGTAGSYRSRTETRDDAGQQASQSGFFQTSNPSPSADWYPGASSWQHLLDIRHSNNANNYAMQFAGSFFDQRLYFRKTNNSASQTWSEVMTMPVGTASSNNSAWALAADFSFSADDLCGGCDATYTNTNLFADNTDDATVVRSMPFSVTINGVSYSQVSICSNGWIAFGSYTGTDYFNNALPTSSFGNLPVIFPYWDDLKDYGSGERVVCGAVGTAPNRVFLVDYVMRTVANTSSGETVSFQVQIHEGSGLINVKYRGTLTASVNGQSATIGFQLDGGSSAKAYPIVYNGKVLDDNRADAQGWSVAPVR